jgi:hypothetical protein
VRNNRANLTATASNIQTFEATVMDGVATEHNFDQVSDNAEDFGGLDLEELVRRKLQVR